MGSGRLWLCLALVVFGSFALLIYFGANIYRQAPPIPERVITPGGDLLFTGEQAATPSSPSAWFVLGLKTGWSVRRGEPEAVGGLPADAAGYDRLRPAESHVPAGS